MTPARKYCVTCAQPVLVAGIRGGRNAKNCSPECSRKWAVIVAINWQKSNPVKHRRNWQRRDERQREAREY